jgi:hypothetical protein
MMQPKSPTAVLSLLFGLLLWMISWPSHVQAQAGETCELNGQIFQRGESLGTNFVTRCGPADRYPCFCNPDLNQQIECPYCGFALEGGGLLCGKDSEINTFTDLDGNTKTCECSAPLGGPSPTFDCELEDEESSPNEPIIEEDGGSCTFDLPDGTSVSLLSGEPLSSVFNNRCGDDFPCYCDPNSEGQVSCPYCRFAALGGDMFCARDGQVIALQDEDGVNQMCSCTISPGGEPSSNCNFSTGDDTPSPVPDDDISTPVDQLDVCTLDLEDSNQVITFQNGESFGDYLTTRCGSSSEFPCFCNTALPNKVDCPYCGFGTSDGGLVCARNDETVDFVDGDTYRTCTCEIVAPGQEPIRTCEDGDIPPPTAAPTEPIAENPTNGDGGNNSCMATGENGEIVVVEDGASFANLISPGVCGSTDDWPAFCNVGLINTISRQEGGGTVEYPYCIFENTQSGVPVCAKSNGRMTFVDDAGVTQQCSCTYLSPSLGGAQSTCVPDVVADDAPTPSPVQTPTVPSSASQKGGIMLKAAMSLSVALAMVL